MKWKHPPPLPRLALASTVASAVASVALTTGCVSREAAPTSNRARTDEAAQQTAQAVTAPDGSTPSATSGTPGTLSSANLQLTVSKNSCSSNGAQDYFDVQNGGTSPATLSDITIKYWVYDTTGVPLAANAPYGGCVTSSAGTCLHQVTGVTATATPFAACGPDPSHQANWEITVSTTDATPLAAGNTWTGVQTGINLQTYANFAPGSVDWYSGCDNGKPYAADAHFGVYSQGNLVFSNGIGAPSCRAPHGTQTITSYTLPPPSTVVGPVAPSTVVSLALGLPLQNLTGLQAIVDQVSNPSSSTYRQYPTQATLAANYFPLPSSYAQLTSWAQTEGLTAVPFGNDILIDVTGTAAQIERALYVNLNVALRPDGSEYYTPDRIPSIDVVTPILGVANLDDYVLPTLVAGPSGPQPLPSTFTSSDVREFYADAVAGSACATLDGTGQSIGIFSLNEGFNQNDIATYENKVGLSGVLTPQVQVTDDPNGASPGCPTCDKTKLAAPFPTTGELGNLEISGDIESAIAMAPHAQVVVFEGRVPDSIFEDMAMNPGISQISSSWVFGMSSITPTLLTVFAAQGQSFFTGSGDSGAYQEPGAACNAAADAGVSAASLAPPGVNGLQAASYVTVVGGTALFPISESTGIVDGETTWSLGGGGVVPGVPLPKYQQGLDPNNTTLSTTSRNLPDVAMIAVNLYSIATNCGGGYLGDAQTTIPTAKCAAPHVCAAERSNGAISFIEPCPATSQRAGQPEPFTGTSASSPLWAGFMALVNEARPSSLGPVGFANPAIYAIGKDPARYALSFHDIHDGSKDPNACVQANQAVAGYDLATGWGSPGCGLVTQMNGGPQVTVGVSGTSQGPNICINGNGFTQGGTVTVQYAGVPEIVNAQNAPQVDVIATALSVGAGGTFHLTDNEISTVANLVATGATNCTPAVIANGVVSVNVVDDTTGLSATTTMPARYFCAIGQSGNFGGGCAGSGGGDVDITYNQVGLCTEYEGPLGPVFAGPNNAYAIFRIDGVDNNTTAPFVFNPNKIFVQQPSGPAFFDSTLLLYRDILGANAVTPDTFPAGVDEPSGIPLYGAAVIANPPVPPAETNYVLSYQQQTGDPEVGMVNFTKQSDFSTTLQLDCVSLGLVAPLPSP